MIATVMSNRATALICALGLIVVACSGEGGDTTTSQARAATTSTTVATDPAVVGPVFRVGLTTGITTLNWWAAMGGSGTPEDQAVLSSTKSSLFTLSRPGFLMVPAVAATREPELAVQSGSVWVVEQPIRSGLTWSDGESVSASDLVFYFEVVREFGLGATHGVYFPASVARVSAPDEHTVRVEFSSAPSLIDWQTGVAMAPLVPAHFWEGHVTAAREAVAAARTATTDDVAIAALVEISLADDDPANDLAPADVAPGEIESYRASVATRAGREALYGVESPQEPSLGPQVFEEWVPGEMAVTRSNPGYHGKGTEYTFYSDGSMRIANPEGDDVVYGGNASGSVEAHYLEGPFVSRIEWHEHATEADAYEALIAGRVDYVYDLDGMSLTMYRDTATTTDLGLSVSPAEGFRFLAFNLRKPPMSDPVFRRAVATLINKEQVSTSLFAGTLFPAYTVVHPALETFYNAEVSRPGWSEGAPMGDGQRYEAAMGLLRDAGYTWDREPQVRFDADGVFLDVAPGEGLAMPNGVSIPDLTILAAPAIGDDPLRATFALWVEQWMRDLGVEVRTEPTDFDSIIGAAVSPASADAALDWDLHVLGWGRPNLALPGLTLVALFHSRNGIEVGGLNTTGYESSEFDAAADSFLVSRNITEAAAWTREMERIIAQDLPYVTLYRPPVIEAFAANVVFPVSVVMGGHASIPGAWPASVRLVE